MNETKPAATLVIWFVGVYALASMVGSFAMFAILSWKNIQIPNEVIPLLMGLSATGGGAVTGLIGLLGRTSSDSHIVTVDNAKSDPIPTTDIKPEGE